MVIGTSLAWRTLLDKVKKVAPSNAPVLIQGETGSGKELVARTLHKLGPRRDAPFLAINCGKVSGRQLESELFGHEVGASTSGVTSNSGLIATAEGGTLFLEEVSEINGPMQVSLLRVLDRGEYSQVGGAQTLRANVRFIGASNRDLQELVFSGRFRDDLLYRINTVTLRVPPLRERPEDIPLLAEHLLRSLRRPGTPPRSFSKEALNRLISYPWPGNVRELRNVVERLILVSLPSRSGPIDIEELVVVFRSHYAQSDYKTFPSNSPKW